MSEVLSVRKTYRPIYQEGCDNCRGEGCDECIEHYVPRGLLVEFECGVTVSYSFSTKTFKETHPGAPTHYKSGSLTGEVSKKQTWAGMSLMDFKNAHSLPFFLKVLGAMCDIEPKVASDFVAGFSFVD